MGFELSFFQNETDVFHIGIYPRFFSIRYFSDGSNYGIRRLGPKRFSWDVWRLGFYFEDYSP